MQTQKQAHDVLHKIDPKKAANQPGDTESTQQDTIVNTDEQNNVLNDEETAIAGNAVAKEKIKDYEEEASDDSPNDPEQIDSDGQLEFPDEDGK